MTRPLGKDEVAGLREDGFALVTIDGEMYILDDLYVCSGCSDAFINDHEMNEDNLCHFCTAMAEETAEADKQMQSDYYANL